LSDQQQFEKADSYYDRATKVDPNNANIFVHRGLIQLQWKGDVAKATEYIERAIKVDDKCEFAYETLGTVEVQRGNLKRSIELFEKAIPLANTELEMAHLFGLMDAATSQLVVTGRLGLTIGGPMM
jgi:import receptor subunit TOM70